MLFDAIIKNGTVFDGRGAKPQKVDIGIKNGEIKKIGAMEEKEGSLVIDAEGKYVAPGFIDITSHSDTHWTLFTHPTQESFLRQGITTIIGGSCGSSLAPLIGRKSLKGISRWIDAESANINWQTAGEFFSVMEDRRLGVNFYSFVGLKNLVDSGEGDMEKIKYLLDSSMEEGMLGLSTNLGLADIKSFGDEALVELFKIVKKYKGISKHHLEDEGKNILPALSRLIQIGRKSGLPIHISHLKILGKQAWVFFDSLLEIIKNAIEDGVQITADFFPYERTGSDLFMLLPDWLRKKEAAEIRDILADKENKLRNEVINHFKDMTLHYDKIIIASSPYRTENIGRTVEEISRITGLEPEEALINLLLINDLHVSIFSEVISKEHIEKIAAEKFSVISSDGVGYDLGVETQKQELRYDLPHPRSFGAFPRALKLFAKEKGILDWEEIIYKSSGKPAEILGLSERGVIKKGNRADIIIINPSELADYSTYSNPFQYSTGIEYVFVNGEMVVGNKRLAEGNLAGKILPRGK